MFRARRRRWKFESGVLYTRQGGLGLKRWIPFFYSRKKYDSSSHNVCMFTHLPYRVIAIFCFTYRFLVSECNDFRGSSTRYHRHTSVLDRSHTRSPFSILASACVSPAVSSNFTPLAICRAYSRTRGCLVCRAPASSRTSKLVMKPRSCLPCMSGLSCLSSNLARRP